MTLDGFLTFLTLLLAVFALISPAMKLRLRLSQWKLGATALVVLLVVLYLQFFEYFGFSCPVVLGNACNYLVWERESGLPADLSFLVVFFGGVVSVLIVRCLSAHIGALPKVSKEAERLLYANNYAALVDFLLPYMPIIVRVERRALLLQRMRSFADSTDVFLRYRHQASEPTWRDKLEDMTRPFAAKLLWLLPKTDRVESASKTIVRILMTNERVIGYISRSRPYDGLLLLATDVWERRDFFSRYIKCLMMDSGSILYGEVDMLNEMQSDSQSVPATPPLLHYLLNDPERAKKLSAWKPVGDCLIDRLSDRYEDTYRDKLKRQVSDKSLERKYDPGYMSLTYFSIMIDQAVRKDTKYHMWLYYLQLFVEELVELYDVDDPELDHSEECPNRAARLIYKTVQTLRGWVLLFDEANVGSTHQSVPDSFTRDNSSIPVSAAIALGACLRCVLEKSSLGEKFQATILEIVLSCWKDLNENYPHNDMADKMKTFLTNSIFAGGVVRSGAVIADMYFLQLLRNVYSKVDYDHLLHDTSEFEDKLDAKLQSLS